jgi:hypothetical protein
MNPKIDKTRTTAQGRMHKMSNEEFEKIDPETNNGFSYRAKNRLATKSVEHAEKAMHQAIAGLVDSVERLKNFPRDTYVRNLYTEQKVFAVDLIEEIEMFCDRAGFGDMEILIAEHEKSEG